MSNEYLDMLQPGAAANAAAADPAKNEYLGMLTDAADRERQAQAGQLTRAVGTNPDQYATKRRVAGYLGYPTAAVEAMPQLEEQAKVQRVQQDTAQSPVLARRFTDADFARLAHDDSFTLAGVETAIARAARYLMGADSDRGLAGDVQAMYRQSVQGTAGAFRAVSELAAAPLNALGLDSATSIGGNPLQRLAEGFDRIAQEHSPEGVPLADGAGVIRRGLRSGVASAGSNLKYLPLAFTGPAGPAAALAGMVAETGGQTFQKDRQDGVPLGTATLHAAADMVAEYTTEKYMGAAGLMKRITAGSGAAKLAMYEITKELPGEIAATIWQNYNEWALVDKQKSLQDFIDAQPEAIGETIVATLVGGGVQIGASRASMRVAQQVLGRELDTVRAAQAAEALQAQLKAALDSKLRERTPEEFRAFVQQVTEQTAGAAQNVYVDAEVLNQLSPAVQALLPGQVLEQLGTALAANDTVAIPVADVLAIAPGTPLEQMVVEHGRIGDPMAPSQAETKEAGKQASEWFDQQAAQVVQQAQDQQAMQQSSDRVRQSLLDQLNTVGRFRQSVNEGYATLAAAFYTTMAGRTGMTPEQMAAKYPLRIVGETGQGQTFSKEAPLKTGEVSVEGYHYSAQDRQVISTGMFGTGLAGSNREKFLAAKDERLRKRAYFYVDKGTGVNPEAGVGGRAHRAQLDNLYDANSDPLRLRGGSQEDFESAVLDHGFRGYLDRLSGTQSAQAILLGDQTVTPELLGPMAKTSGKVVGAPAARESLGRDRIIDALHANEALPNGSPTIARWQEILAKAMPEAHEALKAAGVYDGDQKRTVYRSELIRALANATDAPVYAQSVLEGLAGIEKHLTDVERNKLNRGTAARLKELFDQLPDTKEFAATAWAGRAKRGWYAESAKAIAQVFGVDAPRFAGLLAALSPQTSVQTNLRNAMHTWKNWTAAGRPQTHDEILAILGQSVEGKGGVNSVLNAWVNNSVRALTTDKPGEDMLSGPKVDSFMRNLLGDVNQVTNDAWMANFALVDQKMFAGGLNKTDAGKGPGYLAMNAKVRAAAKMLTQRTGETWTPAEVQETIWSWAKTLYEAQVGGQTATDILYNEELTDDMIRSTPDFRSLFHDEAYANILRDAGYGDRLDSLGYGAATSEEPGAGGQTAPFDGPTQSRLERRAAGRLEELKRRGEGVADEGDGTYEQSGDRGGRGQGAGLAPLPGAPNVQGAAGPDPRLVAVAEQYARDNGIDLKRQGAYVKVDEDRARRLAAAYAAMEHAPNDSKVKEAYDDLIRQTTAQYEALSKAGYSFWFIDPTADPYKSPWDAMRDLRKTQTMGVFPTEAGFGSGATGTDTSGNPLEARVPGLQWPYGGPNGTPMPVTYNDLFRAVHDAFGHGLEGAGFRAEGEENAWQAHVRLFTGSAVGAITSETRGQNSWLNFGPHGEKNQTAKVEDTVFADQKTGLLPEWAWTEGRAGDLAPTLGQPARGTFNPATLELALSPNADLSTFIHESGHFFLEVMADIAAQPDAPAGIQQDMTAVLSWFGVPDLATWQSMALEQKRAHHERFAESFEQYLMEGQAPSLELQPLFRRVRAWMLNVYKSLQSFVQGNTPGPALSPEVRQVFDRLLASQEQIAQTEEATGLMPDEEATAEAEEKLAARSLRDLKWAVGAVGKEVKKLQAQAKTLRKETEEQVRAEVDAMPEFQAQAALKAAEAEHEAHPTSADFNAAVIADSFGFPSVDAMYRAIDAIGKKADLIEARTDQRMLEEHGDLVDERAVHEAAQQAVHNKARAKSLATELKAQAEMLGQRKDTGETNAAGRKVTVNALVEAAKMFGAKVVASTPLRDLKAKAWQHTAAERRAGVRWKEATAAGKTQDAVKAKQDQVLNNAAAKAAYDAMGEARKIAEFFKRVVKDGNEKTVEKGRDPDVVNAARAILAAYGVGGKMAKSALEYMDLVQKNDPAMFAALQPAMQSALAGAQPLAALTFEQLQGLHEEVQAMWHLAKRSRQMEVDGDLMDIDDAADELSQRMDAVGVPLEAAGVTSAMTKQEERARWLQFAGSLLRRTEQWAEGMDGKFGGPFRRLVFQPVKVAADRYRADRTVYRKAYQALLDAVAPSMQHKLIEAPELGYTFGKGHNGIGHAELLHALLHTGNESNKRKLLLGRKWATLNADGSLDTSKWDAFINRMHTAGVLGKVHYDFAQGVWDLLERTKPLAQKTHRDVFGRYFDEVTADSFDTPFGAYRGGYVPAQADPRIVQDADLRALANLENESMAFSFPSTNRGFTKGRVEYNRPLVLDLRTLAQHLDKVLLFAHMESAVRDVNKLLSTKTVSQPLGKIDPTIYSGMLQPWLNRAARQVVETPIAGDGGVSRVLSVLRARAGAALMIANVSNTVQQVTGFSGAFAKLKADGLESHMLRTTAVFIAHPKKMIAEVAASSSYMSERMDNEIAAINDSMKDILLDPSLYERAQAWTMRHSYFLQSALDNTMGPIIWTSAYNAALQKGMADEQAISYADGIIRQTQGSTLPEDVSRIETGPAYARMFTQFVGYFNMMANTNATALKQISSEMGLKKGAGKALGVVFFGLLVPLWVAEAIAQAFKGGPDDPDGDGYLDDWLAAVFGMGTIKGAFAMVPFIGQLANAGINTWNKNPADDRMSLSPAVSLLESAVGAPHSVYKALFEEGSKAKAVKDVATAVSIATGLPAAAVARPVSYAVGVGEGKIEPTSIADAVRGTVTGVASPASKVK